MIRATKLADLKAGDEFIRIASMSVLLKNIPGDRRGAKYYPSIFKDKAHSIYKMVSTDDNLKEVEITE